MKNLFVVVLFVLAACLSTGCRQEINQGRPEVYHLGISGLSARDLSATILYQEIRLMAGSPTAAKDLTVTRTKLRAVIEGTYHPLPGTKFVFPSGMDGTEFALTYPELEPTLEPVVN